MYCILLKFVYIFVIPIKTIYYKYRKHKGTNAQRLAGILHSAASAKKRLLCHGNNQAVERR